MIQIVKNIRKIRNSYSTYAKPYNIVVNNTAQIDAISIRRTNINTESHEHKKNIDTDIGAIAIRIPIAVETPFPPEKLMKIE